MSPLTTGLVGPKKMLGQKRPRGTFAAEPWTVRAASTPRKSVRLTLSLALTSLGSPTHPAGPN